MIIDATTPVGLDRRGHYGQLLDTPEHTDLWRDKLMTLLKDHKK
jgi:hypothetical protein